jgi:lipoprotein-releasing system ATP-binding protein
MSESVLALRGLVRRFKSGSTYLVVLDNVDLDVRPGEIIGLVGPSGSGKSSLLHAAGLLEEPSGGEVILAGSSGWELDDTGRTALRREHIGFVYQFHHLLPEFTAIENVALPAFIGGRSVRETNEEAARLLTALGLGPRLEHRPSQLSGGEQQRVAIARALVNRPLLILADEPTGNLDPDTSSAVFDALAGLVRAEGTSAIIATHNYELTRYMDRVIGLSHGKLVELDKSQPIEPQLAQVPRSEPIDATEEKPKLYPWARFWAKQIDINLHLAIVGGGLMTLLLTIDRVFNGALGLAANAFLLSFLIAVFSYPLFDALFVSNTGGSLGRAIFRFGIRKRNGERPSYGLALSRAWTCLFFGQGLCLGIVCLMTWWASYSNLSQFGASLWDRDAGTEVVHRGPAWWSWLVLMLFLAAYGGLIWLATRPLPAPV